MTNFLSMAAMVSDNIGTLREDYDEKVTQAGLYILLEPERLKNDPEAVESREIIDKVKAIAVEFQNATKNASDVIAKNLLEMEDIRNLSQEEKDEAMKGFYDEVSFAEDVFKLEIQSIDECEAIVILLEEQKGKWRIEEDDAINFEDEAAQRSFYQHIDNIERLSEEYKKIIESRS